MGNCSGTSNKTSQWRHLATDMSEGKLQAFVCVNGATSMSCAGIGQLVIADNDNSSRFFDPEVGKWVLREDDELSKFRVTPRSEDPTKHNSIIRDAIVEANVFNASVGDGEEHINTCFRTILTNDDRVRGFETKLGHMMQEDQNLSQNGTFNMLAHKLQPKCKGVKGWVASAMIAATGEESKSEKHNTLQVFTVGIPKRSKVSSMGDESTRASKMAASGSLQTNEGQKTCSLMVVGPMRDKKGITEVRWQNVPVCEDTNAVFALLTEIVDDSQHIDLDQQERLLELASKVPGAECHEDIQDFPANNSKPEAAILICVNGSNVASTVMSQTRLSDDFKETVKHNSDAVQCISLHFAGGERCHTNVAAPNAWHEAESCLLAPQLRQMLLSH